MNKIKHIIWDWNGTLIDDGWLFVELINCVLKKRGMSELSILDYKNTFCFPLEKYYQKLGFDFNVEPYDVPSMEFVELYNKNKYRPNLYEGVTDLLRMTKNQGIKNYLLSAQNNDSLIDLVNFYNIEQFFEKISGTNNFHARGKALLSSRLLETIGAKNNEILFIGDTNLDVEIASLNKNLIFAATYGHQSKERFPKQDNICLVDSFNDLFSLLGLKFSDCP